MSTLTKKREELIAKQKRMAEIASEAGTTEGLDFAKVKNFDDYKGLDSTAAVELFNQQNTELNALANEVAGLKTAQDSAENIKKIGELMERPDGRHSSALHLHPDAGGGQAVKSIGELITEHPNYKSFVPGAKSVSPEWMLDMEQEVGGGNLHTGVKTLMSTTAGWAPEAVRTGKLVDKAVSPIDFLDLLPGETTNQSAVVYMEETTLTNGAIETNEGTAYTAAALALTERTSPVRKIAVYLPITDEQMEDVPQAQAYVNNRLPYMVRARLNLQALKGSGDSGPPALLEGVQVRSGVQTYALSNEPVFDAVVKGMDKVINTGQAMPDGFVPNASDWWLKFRLARTPDGVYILGNPTDAGPQQLWGLHVAPSQQQTSGTGLVGAFREFSGLAIKKNLQLSVGFINDDFGKGQQSIRCEIRAALQVYRAAAFCTVTNL